MGNKIEICLKLFFILDTMTNPDIKDRKLLKYTKYSSQHAYDPF